jgi:hypothetical protein
MKVPNDFSDGGISKYPVIKMKFYKRSINSPNLCVGYGLSIAKVTVTHEEITYLTRHSEGKVRAHSSGKEKHSVGFCHLLLSKSIMKGFFILFQGRVS